MKLNDLNFSSPITPHVNKEDKGQKSYWGEKNRWLYWIMSLIRATNRYHNYSSANCYSISKRDFWNVYVTIPNYTTDGTKHEIAFSDDQIVNSATKWKGVIDRNSIESFEKYISERKPKKLNRQH